MHFAGSMTCFCFALPVMAPVGHALKHRWQPVHGSSAISYMVRSRHTPASQVFWSMCAWYSCRKYRNVDSTGFGADFPSSHSDPSCIPCASRSMRSRSPGRPRPARISSYTCSICFSPSRHGVHLPHDSSTRKFRK